ncbi:ATP-binding protein [Streptomyces sp. WAC 01325]|uniref:ATP-binding protein n=1 Tax=Streptomyces TaxID=1883 RepID=UPI000F873C02|nr:ATP-binding protein [Streptomyces sp. WAC 01325]RSM92345.1 ATP-binding protein [Streptomyces sp. WAC 01325]WCH96904.1 ATP-binding protein [Streptomyces moderatus]
MTTAQLTAAPRGEVEHVFSLPHVPGAVAGMRQRVRAVLSDWNLTADCAADVLLVVSELLTNAIVHAVPPATLRLSRSLLEGCGTVRVEVTDLGPAAPAEDPTSTMDPDEHGRGLDIVNALASRCGVHVHTGGTSHWAELPSA